MATDKPTKATASAAPSFQPKLDPGLAAAHATAKAQESGASVESFMPNLKEIETLMVFEARISHAIMTGQKWVETSTQILEYFCPRGFGFGPRYMLYKGIHVCETGKIDEIEAKLNVDMNREKHGSRVGTFMGRT